MKAPWRCLAELEDALYECFLMARRGKTKTVDEWNFDVFWKKNLEQLAQDIIKRRWKPSSSKAFVIHTPVDREILAAQFRDRIVHHLLYAIVAPWWERRFIYDSYSCRRNKGTDFGIKRMQKFMRQLFRAPVGQGIVIGNLTSQLLSNIMLNEFDWYMKRKLGFRYFGRYVDDSFVIVPETEYEEAISKIRNEAANKLKLMGLKMHPKKIYIQEVSHGCPFLGKMVRPFVLTPGKRYLKNMRKAFCDYVNGDASYDTMQSYVGMGKNMAAYTEMKKVISRLEVTDD